MGIHEIDQILREVAEPFDLMITEKGIEIEELLQEGKRGLLDSLDQIHWDRATAMCSKAYEVGIAVGRAISSFLSIPDSCC